MAHRTTISAIRRFEALASTGLCRTHAARAVGRSGDWGVYWARRYGLQFSRRGCQPPPDAIARLRRTWRTVVMARQQFEAIQWLRDA